MACNYIIYKGFFSPFCPTACDTESCSWDAKMQDMVDFRRFFDILTMNNASGYFPDGLTRLS